MKNLVFGVIGVVVGVAGGYALANVLGGSDGTETAVTKATLESDADKISYLTVYGDVSQFVGMELEVSREALVKAVDDALNGTEPAVSDIDAYDAQTRLIAQLKEKQAAESKVELDKNKAEGEAFLAEKAGEEGVQATESGLLYKVVEQGEGPTPTATDRVSVNYEGTLIDGTVFDSSYERGEPTSFTVGGVIEGWQEALQLMPVGSTYMLYIPSDLAYGDTGNGDIGPGAALIFKVELLEIQ